MERILFILAFLLTGMYSKNIIGTSDDASRQSKYGGLPEVFWDAREMVLPFPQVKDPLLFPKDDYVLETKTFKTRTGEKKVTFRSYSHIPYVTKPVDIEYQSLTVNVPIEVNGIPVDAANAPVLLNIGVGGYLSVNDLGSSGMSSAGITGSGHDGNSRVNDKTGLALAAGYVVVSPGCRGRDNKASDGTYYGKAPAAIVDIKAAVRYIRHNKGVIPGNVDWIFSTGVSAGGALSALLGASGNNQMFEPYLREIGAAETQDNIYASACYCPITDLEHADGAYEWMYGTTPAKSGLVDQELSKKLKVIYSDYQTSLKLEGKSGFGTLTADNYDKYLLLHYLIPSANRYLTGLTAEKRKAYLAKNNWIVWRSMGATFTFGDYVKHVGRMKGLPAFDDFELKQPEPGLFGNKTKTSRHFTSFSQRKAGGNAGANLDSDLRTVVNMMNAMYFIGQNNNGCSRYWWLRQGTADNHTSITVIANLATSLENRNKDVNTLLYWDAGHGADEDAEDFIAWIGKVTRFTSDPETDK